MTASNWGENSWGTGEWGEGGNIDVTVGGAGWGENAWNSGTWGLSDNNLSLSVNLENVFVAVDIDAIVTGFLYLLL
jgi:hypothetical protein